MSTLKILEAFPKHREGREAKEPRFTPRKDDYFNKCILKAKENNAHIGGEQTQTQERSKKTEQTFRNAINDPDVKEDKTTPDGDEKERAKHTKEHDLRHLTENLSLLLNIPAQTLETAINKAFEPQRASGDAAALESDLVLSKLAGTLSQDSDMEKALASLKALLENPPTTIGEKVASGEIGVIDDMNGLLELMELTKKAASQDQNTNLDVKGNIKGELSELSQTAKLNDVLQSQRSGETSTAEEGKTIQNSADKPTTNHLETTSDIRQDLGYNSQQKPSAFQNKDSSLNVNSSSINPIAAAFGENLSAVAETAKTATQDKANIGDIIDQIVDKMQFETRGNLSEVKISLKPEHLGDVSFKLSTENGIVTAHFTSENQRVKEAIESSFNSLKDSLRDQGINLAQLTVSLKQNHQRDENPQTPKEKGRQISKISSINRNTALNINGLEDINHAYLYDNSVDYTA